MNRDSCHVRMGLAIIQFNVSHRDSFLLAPSLINTSESSERPASGGTKGLAPMSPAHEYTRWMDFACGQRLGAEDTYVGYLSPSQQGFAVTDACVITDAHPAGGGEFYDLTS